MRRGVATLTPNQTMNDAAARFLELGISGAPVVNSHQECVGILSATDFVRAQAVRREGEGRPGGEWVESHMSRMVQSIASDAPLVDAARMMCADHIHRLPVVDRKGCLVGLISLLDIVAATVAAMEEEAARTP